MDEIAAVCDEQKYKIKLRLLPILQDDVVKAGEFKDKLLKDNQQKMLQIIRSSLYGFDVTNPRFISNRFFGTIKSNKDSAIYGAQSIPITVAFIYGDSATDTWLESDCSLEYNKKDLKLDDSEENTDEEETSDAEESEKEIIELWLDLISINPITQ